MGNSTRLRQIIVNLLNNAIKFTKRGHVSLQLSLNSGSETLASIKFSVIDTGIGIPKEALNKLFSDFTQVDVSTTRKFRGSGLGLSICKRLVNLMGGKIGVESEFGVGSTFWFELRFDLGRPLSA